MSGTERRTAEFDQKSLEWLARRHRHNEELRRIGPVVWNPHYGGFWYVTGHEEVSTVARDSGTFTSEYAEDRGDGLRCIGIMGVPRPEGVPPVGIAEVEGRYHTELRRLLNPFMLPAAVARNRPFVEQAASWLLDRRIEEGSMDMVLDFTAALPAMLTMKMIGLELDRWPHYARYFHVAASHGDTSPEYQEAAALVPGMLEELIEIVERRRVEPTGDILSSLATAELDGRRLTNDQIGEIVWNLIGGGLDTTTSLTALALHHLEAHPELRQRLVEQPDLVESAGEEYLRWTSVNETLTRTCTADTGLGGQRLQRGEYVMVSWLAANFDPTVFDRPDEVIIDRTPNPHLAFGVGPHRCLGIHVARDLFAVMVREVLARIPDFRVDQSRTTFYAGNPELYGIVEMPVTFTPARKAGAARPF